MKVVPQRMHPDGPSNMDMFLRYVCVFVIGLLIGMFVR